MTSGKCLDDGLGCSALRGGALNGIKRFRNSFILTCAVVTLASCAAASPVLATYPGANGKIGFRQSLSPDSYRDVFSINLDGTRAENLTQKVRTM
jgi:hypothetical protein